MPEERDDTVRCKIVRTGFTLVVFNIYQKKVTNGVVTTVCKNAAGVYMYTVDDIE